jgi:hypothetical protein
MSTKFILLKKFLKSIINNKPIENSKDAKPRIKKLVDNNVNSSIAAPKIST